MSMSKDNDPTKKPIKQESAEETAKRLLESPNISDTYKEAIRNSIALQKEGISSYRQRSSNKGRAVEMDVSSFEPYMKLDEINIDDMIATNLLRAERQPVKEKIWRTTANLVGNTAVGLMHDVGALAILATEWGDDKDYTNAITEWANRNRNPFGDVYRQSDYGSGTTFTGTFDEFMNLVQPLVQFGIEAVAGEAVFGALGGAASRGMSSLARSARLAKGIESELTFVRGASKFGQKALTYGASQMEANIPNLITSAGIGYVASVDAAANTYKMAYDKYLKEHPKDIEGAKKFAVDLSENTLVLHTLTMTPLNFASFKPRFMMKGVDKEMYNLLKQQERQILEEGAEKAINATVRDKNLLLQEGLKSLNRENKAVSNLLNKGNKLIDYGKHGLKSGAQFTAMGLVANPATSEYAIEEYLKGNSSSTSSFLKGLAMHVDDIVSGRDPDGMKEVLTSFLNGMIIGPGHRFFSNKLGRTKVYKLDSEGNPIAILNENGKPTGRYEKEKVSKEEANRRNREMVLNKYKNPLIKNLELFENFNKQLDLINEKGEKEAGVTREEVYRQMFDLQSYEMITNEASEAFINNFKEILNIDNTVDLGIEKRKQAELLRQQVTQLKDRIDKGETELISKYNELKDKYDVAVKEARMLDGKTEAILQGFANEIETKDNKGASKYKEDAKKFIQDAEYLTKKYKEFRSLYGGGEEGALGMPEFLLDLEQTKLSAERGIENLERKYSDAKVNYNYGSNKPLTELIEIKTKMSILTEALKDIKSTKQAEIIGDKLSKLSKELENNDIVKRTNEIEYIDNKIEKNIEDLNNQLGTLDISREELTKENAEKLESISNNKNKVRELKKKANSIKQKIKRRQVRLDKIGDARLKKYKESLKDIYNLNLELDKTQSEINGLIRDSVKKHKEIQNNIKTRDTFDKDKENKLLEIEELTNQKKELNNEKKDIYNSIDKIAKKLIDEGELPKITKYEIDRDLSKGQLEYFSTNEGVREYIKERNLLIEEMKKQEQQRKDEKTLKEKVKEKIKNNKVVNKLKDIKEKVINKKENKEKENESNKEQKVNKEANKEEVKTEEKTSNKENEMKTEERKEVEKKIEDVEETTTTNDKERGVGISEEKINSIPKKNGRNAYTIIENDRYAKDKEKIADEASELSNTIRNNEYVIGGEEMQKFADYIDDLAFMINAQVRIKNNDKDTFKELKFIIKDFMNDKGITEDNIMKALNKYADVLDVKFGDNPVSKYIRELSASNVREALNHVSDTMIKMRAAFTEGESVGSILNFDRYLDVYNTAEKVNNVIDKIINEEIIFQNVKAGNREEGINKYKELITELQEIAFVERLTDPSPTNEFMNVADFLIRNYKRSLKLKEGVDEVDYNKELININNILDTLKHYYEGAIKHSKRIASAAELEKLNERELNSLENFYVDENFELAHKGEKERAKDIEKKITPVSKDTIEIANKKTAEQINLRVEGNAIANDSTGFDRESGTQDATVRRVNKIESKVAVKVGDEVKFEYDNDYVGEVNYFDGKKYRKVDWKELEKEYKDDEVWLMEHRPIKVIHNGETVGYVPMLSSINEHTIASTERTNWETERGAVRNLRKEISKGKNGVIVSRNPGMLNLAKEYNTIKTHAPGIYEVANSIAIIRNGGLYVGENRVYSFTEKENNVYSQFEGNPVIMINGTNGFPLFTMVGKSRLDGTNSYNENVVTKHSVDLVMKGIENIFKEGINNKGDWIKSLQNMIYMIDAPRDKVNLDLLASEISSENVGVFAHRDSNGRIEKISFRNDTIEPIEISSAKEFEAKKEEIRAAVSKLTYNVNSKSLGTNAKIIDYNEKGNIIVTEKPYEQHLSEVLMTNLVEKEFDVTDYNVKPDGEYVTERDGKLIEKVYTNNAVNVIDVTNAERTKIVERESKIQEEVNKEIEPNKETTKVEKEVENNDYMNELGGKILTDVEVDPTEFMNISVKKMNIKPKFNC